VNGNLTRDDAVKLAQAALEAHQVKGSPALNAQNYGGFDHGDQPVVFEYIADLKVLNVLALCYRFRKPPRPGLLEAYHNEERLGTNTGGDTVEFRSDSGGLFLSRSYTQKTDPARFVEDTHKLMQAAKYWAEDVLPAVASKVCSSGGSPAPRTDPEARRVRPCISSDGYTVLFRSIHWVSASSSAVATPTPAMSAGAPAVRCDPDIEEPNADFAVGRAEGHNRN
jgi:hypothetical protein